MAKKSATTNTTRPVAPRTRPKGAASPDEDAFTRSLVTHGQAARPGKDGRLPPGATHELVEEPDGRVRAVRRRFSAI